jgi:hypothetical protein
MKRTVCIAGNQDLALDALPLRLLKRLQEQAPEYTFTLLDPHEEWEGEDIILIDTVLGIKDVTAFADLALFAQAPHLTLHDFDVLANLLLLKKLGKLKKAFIIGIPPALAEEEALHKTLVLLRQYVP